MNKKPDWMTDDAWLAYLGSELDWKQACSVSCKYWWKLGLHAKALEATKGVEHGSDSDSTEHQ